MRYRKQFIRGLFFAFLLTCLLTGLVGIVRVPVNAAPVMDAASHVVISQVYGGGGNTGAPFTNDFIELFNRATTAVDLTGWSVQYASATGSGLFSSNVANLSGTINPGQHYLVQLGPVGTIGGALPTPDATLSTIDLSATNGKVVLANTTTGLPCNGGSTPCTGSDLVSIIDLIGYGTANFFEGSGAAPAAGNTTANLRNGCNDTNNNNADFPAIPLAPSPRNSASPANLCTPITVTNVTSSTPDATYTTGAVINITITFSGQVNVAGSPTLLLETGVTDRPATYTSGNGTNTLLFSYTVTAGDSSAHLDYVATNSLSGGTITGATGEAILTLPSPASAGSLGANQNIVIDTPPSIVSFSRQTPSSATTNADVLTFRVTFSEAVTGVDVGDFSAAGTTGTLTLNPVSTSVYDVTVSGGDLPNLNGTVGLNLNSGHNIADLGSNLLLNIVPSTDETYTLDNTAPSITSFTRQSPSSATTNADVLTFRVTFSEAVTGVDVGDFSVAGTTGTLTLNPVSTSVYDVTVSGGDLPNLNGTVGLNLNSGNNITDIASNPLPAGEPLVDEVYTVDNTILLTHLVISEFRTAGPNGADDEFIELYNPTSNWVDISGWKINASSNSGGTSLRATIPASTILRSNQYYLIAKSGTSGYSGGGIVPANLTYGTPISNDGIALVKPDGSIVDQVGMSAVSAYKEGTPLTQLVDPNQSYERKQGGCQDTNDNSADFQNIPSDPQNYSSIIMCNGSHVLTPLITTTTTITAHSPSPSLLNGNVSVSVKVTGTSLSPNGTKVNVTVSGLSTVCPITLNSSGTGTCTIKITSTGTKTITATYLGDNTHKSSSNSVSHQVSTTLRTPTRTPEPTLLPPPPLVGINEFVPRPGHDWNNDGVINSNDEYIELLNHGVVDVDLSGYSLDDEANIGSNPYRLPSIILKPGERIVFYGSQTGLLLSDGGDGVRLLKSNGQLVDAYNYFVVNYPDQAFCRLPDNGGLDDWNQNCYPTPGLQNSLSGSLVTPPPQKGDTQPLCPIADTLPKDFVLAECQPFGNNIWNHYYWNKFGWFGERVLPDKNSKWNVFAD